MEPRYRFRHSLTIDWFTQYHRSMSQYPSNSIPRTQLTVLQTYCYCKSKDGITAREIRSDGAATAKDSISQSSFSVSSGSMRKAPSPVLPVYQSSFISKPILQNPNQFQNTNQVQEFDFRGSPVAPGVQRPPTAMHPAFKPDGPPPHASSIYSVASNVTRF